MKKLNKGNKYSGGSLNEDTVLELMSRSCSDKEDLSVPYEVIMQHLEGLWVTLVKANLSTVVYGKDGVPIAVSLNFDARSPKASSLCATFSITKNKSERA